MSTVLAATSPPRPTPTPLPQGTAGGAVSTVLAGPLAVRGLLRLPVNPDEGFPQSFLVGLGENTYGFELYVNVPEHQLPGRLGPRETIDVVGGTAPAGGNRGPAQGLLVATVTRQQPDGSLVPLMRRRLVPGLLYTARELVLVVDELHIAAGNLNGAGQFGSVLLARVGVR